MELFFMLRIAFSFTVRYVAGFVRCVFYDFGEFVAIRCGQVILLKCWMVFLGLRVERVVDVVGLLGELEGFLFF